MRTGCVALCAGAANRLQHVDIENRFRSQTHKNKLRGLHVAMDGRAPYLVTIIPPLPHPHRRWRRKESQAALAGRAIVWAARQCSGWRQAPRRRVVEEGTAVRRDLPYFIERAGLHCQRGLISFIKEHGWMLKRMLKERRRVAVG